MSLFDREWEPPAEFPNLHGRVALDTETYDPQLKKRGPGYPYKNDPGGVIGYSIAQAGFKGYWPFAHNTGGNLDKKQVLGWLGDQFKNPNIEWCFANAAYDLGNLRREGLGYPAGKVTDIQIQGPLLDEYAFSYSLDNLGKKYCNRRKFDIEVDADKIWRTHPTIVGPYAEDDAELTLAVAEAMWPKIVEEELQEADKLESDLVPVLLDMRFRGLRINEQRATETRARLIGRMEAAKAEIRRITGKAVDPWVAESLVPAFEYEGLQVPLTASGQSSVTKSWMEACVREGSKVAALVLTMRRNDKAVGTFLDGQLLGFAEDGRLHANYNSLRTDRDQEGDMRGTVSYRFSIDGPALQVLPKRDGEMAAEIRGCLEPEEGCDWMSADYKQQEPKMALAFAVKMNATKARAELADLLANPDTWHFHKKAAGIMQCDLGKIKTISLGRMYGAGGGNICAQLGLPVVEKSSRAGDFKWTAAGPEGQAMIDDYDAVFPWIKEAADKAQSVAEERGYIRLLGGYRGRFGQGKEPARKAFNRACQGGGAVQTKRAMVAAWKAGVSLLVQVHDELGANKSEDKDERLLAEAMQDAAPELKVPFSVDIKCGSNWGEIR